MFRTQLYLTKEEKAGLEEAATLRGVSQSNLIRQAIDELLAKTRKSDKNKIIDDIAGIWSDKKDVPDIRELRKSWGQRVSP